MVVTALVVLLAELLLAHAAITGLPTTLLVSFDGMRADYIASGRADTPHFDLLRKEGCTVTPGITPSFITKTFPNHWTLVSIVH